MRGPGLEPTNYAAYGGRRHWDRLRRQVYERDGYRCQRCLRRSGPDGGYEFAIHAHHVVPLSRGGPNSLGNLVSLCPPCHGLQHLENPAFDGLRSCAPPLPAGADPRVAVARRVRVVASGNQGGGSTRGADSVDGGNGSWCGIRALVHHFGS